MGNRLSHRFKPWLQPVMQMARPHQPLVQENDLGHLFLGQMLTKSQMGNQKYDLFSKKICFYLFIKGIGSNWMNGCFELQVMVKEAKQESSEKEEPKFQAFTGKKYSLK